MTDKQINELWRLAKGMPENLHHRYITTMKDAVNNINTERVAQRVGRADPLKTAYDLLKEIITKYDGWGLGDDDPEDPREEEEEDEQDENADEN